MGSCCSVCKTEETQIENTNEKTKLLGDPVGDSARLNSEYGVYRRQSKQYIDEQEKLNKIIQQTANSYIDVPAIDADVEQQDFSDREQQYTKKVAEVKHEIVINPKSPLLEDSPHPDKLLSAEPLPIIDMKLMEEVCEKMHAAIKNVKVKHEEDIVVQFSVQ